MRGSFQETEIKTSEVSGEVECHSMLQMAGGHVRRLKLC